jgi:hypothetical protein
MRSFFLCLLALAPAVVLADSLTPEEAHAILRQAQQASREIGSFKEVKTKKTKYGTATITTYTLIRPDGTRVSRSERVTTVDGHPERTQTSVSLANAEGNVTLFKHHALLFALKFDRAKIPAELQRPAPSEATDETPGVAEEPPQKQADREFQNRLLTAAVRIGPHAIFSGERFVQDGRRRVRIVSSFDEEGQKQMKKLVEDQWAEMKKEIPWAIRLSRSHADGNHEWTRMHTNIRRVNQICRESSGLTVWWLVRMRHDEVRSIRVDSCSFVVQLNCSGLLSHRNRSPSHSPPARKCTRLPDLRGGRASSPPRRSSCPPAAVAAWSCRRQRPAAPPPGRALLRTPPPRVPAGRPAP